MIYYDNAGNRASIDRWDLRARNVNIKYANYRGVKAPKAFIANYRAVNSPKT